MLFGGFKVTSRRNTWKSALCTRCNRTCLALTLGIFLSPFPLLLLFSCEFPSLLSSFLSILASGLSPTACSSPSSCKELLRALRNVREPVAFRVCRRFASLRQLFRHRRKKKKIQNEKSTLENLVNVSTLKFF